MLGGIPPTHNGSVLNCRLRYFDPASRRAGLPSDVAALVDALSTDGVSVTLVNVNQLEPRSVVVQAGGYAEHRFGSVTCEGRTIAVDRPSFTVRLAPGAGGRLTMQTRRYVNTPTMQFPWDP
jgi:hypothetical protein